MERSLLIETVCGLADIALVKENGLPLEDMCDDEGEFLEEYQDQFNTVYDRYEAVAGKHGLDKLLYRHGNIRPGNN